MNIVEKELREKQARWLEQETERNLKLIENEVQLQKMRGRKYCYGEVAFVERKPILLERGGWYFEWIHGLRAGRNARSTKNEISKNSKRSIRKL